MGKPMKPIKDLVPTELEDLGRVVCIETGNVFPPYPETPKTCVVCGCSEEAAYTLRSKHGYYMKGWIRRTVHVCQRHFDVGVESGFITRHTLVPIPVSLLACWQSLGIQCHYHVEINPGKFCPGCPVSDVEA